MIDAKEKVKLIALCVVCGHDGKFLQHKSVAIGIEGEIDPTGQQRWYDTIETLLQFHPEIRWFANPIEGSGVCSEGVNAG